MHFFIDSKRRTYSVDPWPDHRPTSHWVLHATSCIAQSKAPDDGQNCCPKHVELIWIYQQIVIIESSWLASLPSILMMHGQTNIYIYIYIYKYKIIYLEE